MEATVHLFYDDYEYNYGDGLYPIVEKTKYTPHYIDYLCKFKYNESELAWHQEDYEEDHRYIKDLDLHQGEKLLKILNDMAGVAGTKIYNRFRCIFSTNETEIVKGRVHNITYA